MEGGALLSSPVVGILPCPFCGGKATLGHITSLDVVRMQVRCTREGCWATIEDWIGDSQSVERVIEAWNRRAKQ